VRGEEVLKHIKSDLRMRYTPVIILTGGAGYDKQLELLDKGADDFIEKGAAPEILIARLRAQMRHKLAFDRLERLALDRDLFAAGVLQDIGNIKGTILAVCKRATDKLQRDPVGERAALKNELEQLTEHAHRLGQYAADVIQSVRDTQREAGATALDVGPLFDWAVSVLASDATGARLTWQAATPLVRVCGDQAYLRMAILHLCQDALGAAAGKPVQLVITQSEHTPPDDPKQRRFVTTRIADAGRSMPPAEVATYFHPYQRGTGSVEPTLTASTGGLGPALVAKVMAKMGGGVTAELASPGIAFCLDLPRG
jgi:signal transduction histidine kinase